MRPFVWRPLRLEAGSEAQRATVLAWVRAAQQRPALPIDRDRLRAADRPRWRTNHEAARFEGVPVEIAQAFFRLHRWYFFIPTLQYKLSLSSLLEAIGLQINVLLKPYKERRGIEREREQALLMIGYTVPPAADQEDAASATTASLAAPASPAAPAARSNRCGSRGC